VQLYTSAMTGGSSLLRVRHAQSQGRVTFVELFFDLVFVFAVTQLSHSLLEHLTPSGAIETLLLLFAVWWVWIYTAWVTNWLDPERTSVRIMLFALMLVGLVMSASIPKAFESQGLPFACAYVAIQVGRSTFMAWALRNHDPKNCRNFQRILAWFLLSAVFWIWGGLAEHDQRLSLWGLALFIELMGPWCYFWVPGLGRSRTEEWNIDGGHLAERCALFVIIALGESILVTGATSANLPVTAANLAGFLAAFFGTVAMWWLYFNIGAERNTHHIAASADPGRLGRIVYTYIHLLIVAGIVVCAVADEIVISHPDGHVALRDALVILGGPALYLIGNICFKRASAQHMPLSHLVGLGLLALLAPFYAACSPLILGITTTVVLMIVATWETISLRKA
jgi:low temperature requirement protein LtrA